MTTAIIPFEPGKIPASPDLSAASNDELADYVIGAFSTIREALPYIAELRNRFAALQRGRADIKGCATWTEFCETHLHRTGSAVRKALAKSSKLPPPVEPRDDAWDARRNNLSHEIQDALPGPRPVGIRKIEREEKTTFNITLQVSSENELKQFVNIIQGGYNSLKQASNTEATINKAIRKLWCKYHPEQVRGLTLEQRDTAAQEWYTQLEQETTAATAAQ